ncbi:ERAD-associated E3 ubiquitin-protein ligase component HRD3 [Spathaspora sp. JA1]|nr:ERAD-associated E3 ubiquitin-protein ligase component HRD3 [Spathaspora sp. JA1]
MTILNSLNYSPPPPIYNLDNIEGNLYIPQYNNTTRQYETIPQLPPPAELAQVIPMLEKASRLNHTLAMVTLADMYIFGNYSMPTNYPRAEQLYHQATTSGNGHAYFMLGLIYSTGLFGQEIDQERANLYYQFGVENSDMNSILVMAYRNNRGIDMVPNCEIALNYYVHLANLGMDNLLQSQGEFQVDYNIRVSDFNGGLYGEKMSETRSSIEVQSRVYSDLRSQLEEYNINTNDDHEFVNLYFQGLEYLKGDYFTSKNYTVAFEKFDECVKLGDDLYQSNNYKVGNSIDKMFLSSCQSTLAKLYMLGIGTDKDIPKAKSLYELSLKIQPSAETYNDLGMIEQQGLLTQVNTTQAIKHYVQAVKHKSPEGNRNLSLLLLNMTGGSPHKSDYRKEIFSNMKQAAYLGDIQALFHLGNFLQMGLSKYAEPEFEVTCTNTILYYKVFIERLSSFYAPHLKYAFQELIRGNFNNALIGYMIAAEQGFEPAQISTAYLLYQLQPLYSTSATPKKTFTEDRIQLAIRYLERASKQGNDDATVLLGDIYSGSYTETPPILTDYERAFNFYRIASDRHSSHGAYKLGEMYEYGIGPNINNNSVDYFMAKRYYDSSLQFKERLSDNTVVIKSGGRVTGTGNKGGYSKAHISLALLRLRVKYMFNKNAVDEEESGGWLSAFRKVRIRHSLIQEEPERVTEEQIVEQDYDIGDYLVIGLTGMFFLIFFVQNVIRSIRRMRNNRQGNEDDDDNVNPRQNQWNLNFRRGNFEIHFFAL